MNFISSKDNVEESVMHSKSDNIETMINDKADKVIERLFKSLTKKYQIGLEKSIRGSDFLFNCVHLLYYKRHKVNLNYGKLQIASPGWTKNKEATINLIDKKITNAFNTLQQSP